MNNKLSYTVASYGHFRVLKHEALKNKGQFKQMDSISYAYISWTLHGMWWSTQHLKEEVLNFQILPLERSPSSQPCSSVSWEQNGYYAATSDVLLWYTWSAGDFAFTQTAYLLKLVIPMTNVLPRWRLNVETKTKRTLHSSRRLSFNEFTNAKNLVLHSSHFVLNWRCCTAVR